jgi:hypothetical protein
MLLSAKASATICDSQAKPVHLAIVDRVGNRKFDVASVRGGNGGRS